MGLLLDIEFFDKAGILIQIPDYWFCEKRFQVGLDLQLAIFLKLTD